LQIAAVNLNGAAVQNSDGHDADFSAALNVGLGLQVGPLPTMVAITATADNQQVSINAGHQVTITVTANEAVTVTGNPTLQLSDNEVAIYATGSGGSVLTFTYTVQPGDNTSDLQVVALNLPAGATIQDGVGNNLAGSVSGDLAMQVDTTPPTATKIGSSGNRVGDFEGS
jgi:hypothetical protein